MKNTPQEWARIQRIQYRVQRSHKNCVVPLGDDAFVFQNFPGYSVICQDMLVEDIHFSTSYYSAFDLGHKALAVNLSDIAAMGAKPHFVQVSLAIPENINDSWLDDFYVGMTQLSDKFACQVVGGDLSKSPDKIVVDVSIHGSVDYPLTRKGAQPGDLLLCSGPLGLSHTGLLAFQNQMPHYEQAKRKHLRPDPRLDLVPHLQVHKEKVHALMDCSDGLINDALILANENKGFHIFMENLPLHPETQKMAMALGLPSEDFPLWGGEDFELLLAISPNDYDFFPGWNLVGQFTAEKGVYKSTSQQKIEITDFQGWKHFK